MAPQKVINKQLMAANRRFFILLPLFVLLFGVDLTAQNKDTVVLIETSMGNMKIRLYNETPLHRSNFIKLVKDGFYDSLLFHRVISQFMIQGGDPDSKNAKPGVMLGMGGTSYTIPAEINPQFHHKKGALAAARQGDEVNPKKESSGCQFYIVHGKAFTNADLDMLEARANQGLKQQTFSVLINKPENAELKQKFIRFQQGKMMDSLQALNPVIEAMVAKEIGEKAFKYSEQQRKDYTTIGGSPHLDNNYTVYGEVIEGLDVVDKIAAAEVGEGDRPKLDIRMTIGIFDPKMKKDKSKKNK